MSAFTVVLDACVLYPASVRDLMLRLALTGMFAAKWTDEIQDEWIRSLLRDRKDIDPKKLERTREMMNEAVLDARVIDYKDLIPVLSLPDPDDRHVLAAAIRSRSSAIVSFNTKDFPEDELSKYDIELIDPDDFIVLQMGLSESTVCEVVKTARASLKSPALSVEEYLSCLAKCGLTQTVEMLRPFAKLL